MKWICFAGIFLVVLAGGPLALVRAEVTSAADPDLRKVVEDYCTLVTDLAAERRVARQNASLKALQDKVDNRLNLLDERTQELAELIRKRDELRNLAQKELVDIYAGMDTEAAAAQMERLDFRLGSSVLRQLKPRQASAILNVMKPALAAEMVRLIAVATEDARPSQ